MVRGFQEKREGHISDCDSLRKPELITLARDSHHSSSTLENLN